jgi:N2-acetyl-L-2,4-diaminobutanoate deacetylase
MIIEVDRFDPREVTRAGKHSFFLEFSKPGLGEQIGLPLLIAIGEDPGKTLVALAAVHGDELEGVQAIHEVFHQLETREMSGRFIAVPVANLPAFREVQRLSPVDSLNLARTFPGRKDGTLTERIAFYLTKLIIPEADCFIDLHSSGMAFRMPIMVGYDAGKGTAAEASKRAAFQIGTPVVWGHPEISPGRSICSAADVEIPWLYMESPNGGSVSSVNLPYYVNGLLNLLGHLQIISRNVTPMTPEIRLFGSGDLDRIQTVSTAGFFVSRVGLMERVGKGQSLGIVRNLFGETIEEVNASQEGFVALVRNCPVVNPGDAVFLVADGETYHADDQ